jgi:hypothetical protein
MGDLPDSTLTSTTGWRPEQRVDLLSKHPLSRRSYTIPTPMVQSAYAVIRERVFARRAGLVFIGETRIGKTTCAVAVRDYLLKEFPEMHVVVASARSSPRPTNGHVYRIILEAVKHVCSTRVDGVKAMNNVIVDVCTSLEQKGGDQFVLILDEVNLLMQADMVNLLELHNLLKLRGVCMTVISFAQPTIHSLISALHAQNQNQLIERFFRKPMKFYGCESEEILMAVLEHLDDNTEWPEGSGWTYTEFFFPTAYKNKFRLQNYAGQIWTELLETVEPNISLTMEAVALTVEWLCLSLHEKDDPDFVITREQILQAIVASDLV